MVFLSNKLNAQLQYIARGPVRRKARGPVAELMAHIDLGSCSGCEDSGTEQSTTTRPPGLETSEKTRLSQAPS